MSKNAAANYWPAVEVLAKQTRPGDVVSVRIEHDPDCAHWHGEPCDCDPDVTAQAIDREQLKRQSKSTSYR